MVILAVIALILALAIAALAHQAESDDGQVVTFGLAMVFSAFALWFAFVAGAYHAIPDIPTGKAVRVLASYTLPNGKHALDVEVAPNHLVTRVELGNNPRLFDFGGPEWMFPENAKVGQQLIRISNKTLMLLADSTRFGP